MLIAKQYTSATLSMAIIFKDLFTPQKYDFYMGKFLLENIGDINSKIYIFFNSYFKHVNFFQFTIDPHLIQKHYSALVFQPAIIRCPRTGKIFILKKGKKFLKKEMW